MSKKIAEGTDALVLDVKVGAGAFLKSLPDARRLADAMVAIGTRAGLRTRAVLTAMEAPLGLAVGNSLEVIEAIETLKGRGPDDFRELCLLLSAHLLVVAGLAPDLDAARRTLDAAVASGAALDRFRQLIAHQGGDAGVVDDYGRFAQPARVEHLASPAAGYVAALKADTIGRASMLLGAGREQVGDAHRLRGRDRAARPAGRSRGRGRAAGRAPTSAGEARVDQARALAASAFTLAATPPPRLPLVLDVAA